MARRSAEFKSARSRRSRDLHLADRLASGEQSPRVMADGAPAGGKLICADRGRAFDAIVPQHPRDDADEAGAVPTSRWVDPSEIVAPPGTIVLAAPDRSAPSIRRSRGPSDPRLNPLRSPMSWKTPRNIHRRIGDHGGARRTPTLPSPSTTRAPGSLRSTARVFRAVLRGSRACTHQAPAWGSSRADTRSGHGRGRIARGGAGSILVPAASRPAPVESEGRDAPPAFCWSTTALDSEALRLLLASRA